MTGYSTAAAGDVCLIVLRSTSKMTAVDQANTSTPFIAVIGPISRRPLHGNHVAVSERRVVHKREIQEIDSRRPGIDDRVSERPNEHLAGMRRHQDRYRHNHDNDHMRRWKQPVSLGCDVYDPGNVVITMLPN